jgi:DNA-binding SARP family transcriptional activator
MQSAVRVEFRLFGAVRARAGQGLVDLGPAKQRCVLAVLLMSPGRAVAVETLIDRVWGDDPPDGARSTLYSYLTRLRRALVAAGGDGGPVAAITRRADGYLLEVPSERVDVHRFGERECAALRPTTLEAATRADLEAFMAEVLAHRAPAPRRPTTRSSRFCTPGCWTSRRSRPTRWRR